jgi:hypothetical protein
VGSILTILALSANTAFADFPRLCRAIALNNYLPHSFNTRGRRLVYTQGIVALAVLAGLLLIVFRGVTDRLIPLFAVGAFLAFTLSQAGMVGHWMRVGGPGAKRNIVVNGLGAIATGITVVIVLAAKFVEGAWITALLIPALLISMGWVRRHYHRVFREIRSNTPLELNNLTPPLIILPFQNWNHIVKKSLRFALKISPDIRAVHVDTGESLEKIHNEWEQFVEEPTRRAGLPVPKLIVVKSPYRLVLAPIISYVLDAELENPDQQIAVLIPELVQNRFYQNLLHNKRASVLKALLLLKGNQRIIVINVPWYLGS